ncbi:hypothetical protein QYE76_059324 [Lolium multiflorum]|uniref:Uncharacterized protein n=1 Tax=Lolium multiflorum TaxID=4521 RepID=A0AAD8QK87_LOLMU|nr:hypothetical protein QYE76_059324 [Lolium multiflorum]
MGEGQGAHGGGEAFPAARTETGGLGGVLLTVRHGGGGLQRAIGRGSSRRRAMGTEACSTGGVWERRHGDGACSVVEVGLPASRHGDGGLQRAVEVETLPGGAPWRRPLQRAVEVETLPGGAPWRRPLQRAVEVETLPGGAPWRRPLQRAVEVETLPGGAPWRRPLQLRVVAPPLRALPNQMLARDLR